MLPRSKTAYQKTAREDGIELERTDSPLPDAEFGGSKPFPDALDAKSQADKALISGLALIAGAGLIFSGMTVLTAIAGRDIPSFEIVFISCLVRWAILATLVRRSGECPWGKPAQRQLFYFDASAALLALLAPHLRLQRCLSAMRRP